MATILVIAITYIFTSLTLNSHLDDLPGADAIKMVLGLGLGILAPILWDYCSLCQQLCHEKSFKGAWSL
ncbi:ABC-type antimicrobial peptide transportsystem, permease component [Streptococcus sp. HSISS2]|nr:ABC-type antimicrobial peptide transportsystem, permease component [Streptococcus sp. HSISS2]